MFIGFQAAAFSFPVKNIVLKQRKRVLKPCKNKGFNTMFFITFFEEALEGLIRPPGGGHKALKGLIRTLKGPYKAPKGLIRRLRALEGI